MGRILRRRKKVGKEKGKGVVGQLFLGKVFTEGGGIG